jgi:hypothetical protein
MSYKDKVQSEVQALHDKYIAGLKAIARRVQLEVVNPFCDRHGLWFVQRKNAWVGDFVFGFPGKPAPNSGDWDEWLENVGYRVPKNKPPAGYARVHEIIDEPIPGQMDEEGLRYFMEEYKPKRKSKP